MEKIEIGRSFWINFSPSLKVIHELCGGEVIVMEQEKSVELSCTIDGYLFSMPLEAWKELIEMVKNQPLDKKVKIELTFSINGKYIYTETAASFQKKEL